MKKIFTFAAAVLASISLAWADYDVPENGTITLSTKVNNSGRFSVEAPGVYQFRLGGGYSWADGKGIKTQSNQCGVVFYLDDTYNVGVILQHAEAKNAHDVTVNVYSIAENLYAQFDGAKAQAEEKNRTFTNWEATATELNFTIAVAAEIGDFSEAQTLPAGFYAIVPVGEKGNTYFNGISFEANGTPSTDPVESAVINGENACVLGGSVELTCTADKATTYQWYLGGAAIDGATAKKYTFAPSAEGTYSFTCSATNDYTATPVMSDAFVVTVVDPASACGELIKATHTGAKTATVTGVLGGTADKSTASDSKFGGKGQWFGITLAAGTFQAGDELNVHTTKAAEQGTLAIYADKSGETMLYDSESFGGEGDNIIILPASLSNATTLYICRTETNSWNGYVDYIAVNRSCEASSNADLAKVWVMAGDHEMTFEPEADGVTYNLVVPATEDIPELSINFSLAHPKATANVNSPFVLTVPAAGAPANSKQIIVTAEDGTTTKTYTINVSKSAEASHDASLKSLAVTGYTLDPAFASDVYTYTITKAYGAENPGTDKVVCEPNDATAHDNIQAGENSLIVTVTAEDGKTKLTYTINIVEAAAKKDLLEVTFSNGVHGYIANGNINVPYLAGETEPAFVSATFWNPDGEPTAEMVNGKLVVTGIDNKTAEYTITYVALTPMEASYDEITFTEVPSYIYSIYGWDADKGVKFSKDVEEATNHRISEGKDRIYIALPVAKEVILTSGSGGARPVIITVNGKVRDIEKTAASGGTITIPLVAQEGANLVGIESNGNNGDAGFIKLQLVEGTGTAIENTDAAFKAVKVVRDGQMMILKNGILYNMQGAVVK